MSTLSAGTTVTTALVASGDTTGALTFQVNGTTTAATIDTSGNLGVGTTSPVSVAGYKILTLNGSTGGGWYLQNNGTSVGAASVNSGGMTFGTVNSTPTIFITNASERMRIDASGNVGIGSTTPGTYSERLVVASPGSAQASMMLMNPGQGSGQLGIAASGSNFKIYNTYTDGLLANGKGIDITSTGNVLLGTSTGLGEGARLDIVTASGEADVTTWRYNNAAAGKY